MTTLSIDSLTSDPVGTENGLVVRNIPSGVQETVVTDGYGDTLGTLTNPIVTEITDGYGNVLGTIDNPIVTTSGVVSRNTLTFVGYNFNGTGGGEAMVTLTPYSDFVAGTNGTSFAVDVGKTLRLQTIILSGFNGSGFFRLRVSSSGSVTTSTAVIMSVYVSSGTITSIPIPEGLELVGSSQFGISQGGTASGGTFTVTVVGYEY